jgi:hypothetical protein
MPRVIVSCRVLQPLIELCQCPDQGAASTIFMDYGLHRTPERMREALQAEIDRIVEPSTVIMGYGLCGNGLMGLQARQHTLIVPRADDCISLLLGSYQRYREEFSAEPGTYYLTRGWLESGSNPLSEYQRLAEKYGQEDADWVIDEQYRNYRRLVLVASEQSELDACRPQAQAVADFCAARWGFRYEERIGSTDFIRELVTHAPQLRESTENFLVIRPGGEIRQEMFSRP